MYNLLLSFHKNNDLCLPWRKKSLHNPILPLLLLRIFPVLFQDHLLPSLQHQYDLHNLWCPFLQLLVHSRLSNEFQKWIIKTLFFTPNIYIFSISIILQKNISLPHFSRNASQSYWLLSITLASLQGLSHFFKQHFPFEGLKLAAFAFEFDSTSAKQPSSVNGSWHSRCVHDTTNASPTAPTLL